MRYYILIGSFILIISFVYLKGKKDCEQKNLLEHKETEIITKEIIINQTKQVNERRNKVFTATPDDNLLWLKENICQDCR